MTYCTPGGGKSRTAIRRGSSLLPTLQHVILPTVTADKAQGPRRSAATLSRKRAALSAPARLRVQDTTWGHAGVVTRVEGGAEGGGGGGRFPFTEDLKQQ